MIETPNSLKKVIEVIKEAKPQQIIVLSKGERRKIQRINISYVISQFTTIFSFYAIEINLGLSMYHSMTSKGKYPYSRPDTTVEPSDLLIAGGGVTSWHLLSNFLYNSLKYHGKRTYWFKIICYFTYLFFAGISLSFFMCWYVSYQGFEFAGASEYEVYSRKSTFPLRNS